MEIQKFVQETRKLVREDQDMEHAILIQKTVLQSVPDLLVNGQTITLASAISLGYATVEASPDERKEMGDFPFPVGMSYLLFVYKQQRKVDDAAIAQELQCSIEEITLLRQFLAPRPHSEKAGKPNYFRRDVTQMAEIVQCAPVKLANFVNMTRRIDSTLTSPSVSRAPLFLHVTYADGGDKWILGRVE